MRKGISFSVLLLCLSGFAQSAEKITVKDLAIYGWDYVGKKVEMTAFLDDVYRCTQPSNRGQVCGIIYGDGETFGGAIFKKGTGRKIIEPLIKNCVKFDGRVKEVDYQTEGAKVTAPSLQIDNAEALNLSSCKR